MASGENGLQIGTVETYFAKKLANNSKTVRYRAMKRLKTWLCSKSGDSLCELEMMKLWKGLFYCMWFSDKPLVREDLASSLSQVIDSLKDNLAVCIFVDSFFQTMGREWHGIDRLRLDKFYMFVRKMLREVFAYLQKSVWNGDTVEMINGVLRKGPCCITNDNYPDGLRMFVAEIFIDELLKIDDISAKSDTLTRIIDPFVFLAARSTNTLVFRSIEESIFKKLLPGTDNFVDGLKIEYLQFAERIFEEAGDKNVPTKRRKCLFRYADLFREASKVAKDLVPVADVEQREENQKTNKMKVKNQKRRRKQKSKTLKEKTGEAEKKEEINSLNSFEPTETPETGKKMDVDQDLSTENGSVSVSYSESTDDPVVIKLDFEDSFATDNSISDLKKKGGNKLKKTKRMNSRKSAQQEPCSESNQGVIPNSDVNSIRPSRRSQRKRKTNEAIQTKTAKKQTTKYESKSTDKRELEREAFIQSLIDSQAVPDDVINSFRQASAAQDEVVNSGPAASQLIEMDSQGDILSGVKECTNDFDQGLCSAKAKVPLKKRKKSSPVFVERRESLARSVKKKSGIKDMDKVESNKKDVTKKRVVFELSKNAVTSISQLAVSSAAVFTPDQKPKKGVLKMTPTPSPRTKAADYF